MEAVKELKKFTTKQWSAEQMQDFRWIFRKPNDNIEFTVDLNSMEQLSALCQRIKKEIA